MGPEGREAVIVAHGYDGVVFYPKAVLRLGVGPVHTVAVQDSHSGILAAEAAGMIAILNGRYSPA